jgi:hypothetical protein
MLVLGEMKPHMTVCFTICRGQVIGVFAFYSGGLGFES